MKSRRKMTIAIVLLVALSPFLLMTLYVDDWSRDLTTNVAWTDPDGDDESLRHVEFVGGVLDLNDAIDSFDERHANWSQTNPPALLPESSPVYGMTAQTEGEARFHLVRATGLFGYRDDVWLVAEPVGKEPDDAIRWRLHAHSQSRVGKGDLGQNPRNLRELLGALREVGSVKIED